MTKPVSVRVVRISSIHPSGDEAIEYYAPKIKWLDEHDPDWRNAKYDNGFPMYVTAGPRTGMLLDDHGHRSIFDDLDD